MLKREDSGKTFPHRNEFLNFRVLAPPAVSGGKEWPWERLQQRITQPVFWLLTCCCPSTAEGTAGGGGGGGRALAFLSSEKDSRSLLDLYNMVLLHFPTARRPTVTGIIARSHRIPAPAGLSGCACIPTPPPARAQPCSSCAVSHHLPSPSLPLGEGLWVPCCAHTAEAIRKACSGCAFICLPRTQQGHHLGATPTEERVCSLLFRFLSGRWRRVTFKYNAASSMLLSRACLIADAAGAPGLVPAQVS